MVSSCDFHYNRACCYVIILLPTLRTFRESDAIGSLDFLFVLNLMFRVDKFGSPEKRGGNQGMERKF